MDKAKFNLSGTSMAIVAAIAFLIIALLAFPFAANMFWKLEQTSERLTFAQVVVSTLGFIGAISAFTFAIIQYRKAEKWKRMQFVADEVRELETDRKIENALLMADWGVRKLNLTLVPDPKPEEYVLITREMQWRALLPHPVKKENKDYWATTTTYLDGTSGESRPEYDSNFSATEVLIRDSYDALLTRLDRLETFIDAGLISEDDLKPFIYYWVKTMTKVNGAGHNATWRLTLLTYIDYYEFTGVQSLFDRYEKNIEPKGDIYQAIKNKVENKDLARILEERVTQVEQQATTAEEQVKR